MTVRIVSASALAYLLWCVSVFKIIGLAFDAAGNGGW